MSDSNGLKQANPNAGQRSAQSSPIARAVDLLRRAGWPSTALRLKSGERTPAETLTEVLNFWGNDVPIAVDAAAIAALEACVSAQSSEASSVAAPVDASGPTARDAVGGMVLRYGFAATARDVAEGRVQQAAETLRGHLADPGIDACRAALEALARADPRAVLATVAELLGLTRYPRDTTKPDERSVEQIEAEASALDATQPSLAMRMRNYARGIREGERRAQARQAESPPAVPDREQLGRAVHEVGSAWDRAHGEQVIPWEAVGAGDRELVSRIGERLFTMGVEEGERRAKKTAAGLLASWEEARRHSLKLRDATSKSEPETWARRDSSALTRRSCMLELSDAFDVPLSASPDDGQPPTGGEPEPDGKDVVADRATTGHGETAQTSTDADERWQPGAVWEHHPDRFKFPARLEVEHLGADGSRVLFKGGGMKSRADMTPEKGWRYIGRHASEARPEEPKAPDGARAAAEAALAVVLDHHDIPDEQQDAALQDLVTIFRTWGLAPALPPTSSAIERARADGVVEGLTRARRILGDRCQGHLRSAIDRVIEDAIDAAKSDGAPADRQLHVDRTALLALVEGWETSADRDRRVMRGLGIKPGSLSAEGTRLDTQAKILDRCAAGLRRLLDTPHGPGGGECDPAAPERVEMDQARAYIGARDGESLIAAMKRVGDETADIAAKRAAQERDAAYQRGQGEMRERAARRCGDAAKMMQLVGKPDEARELLAAHYAILALPISKTPTVSACEEAGEAIPGAEAAETAGAGESVARAPDLATAWKEQAGARRKLAQNANERHERAYHDGQADALAICAAMLKDRRARECCDASLMAALRQANDRISGKLRAHSREIAEWCVATGCQTPAEAREASRQAKVAVDALAGAGYTIALCGSLADAAQRAMAFLLGLKAMIADYSAQVTAWRAATGCDTPEKARERSVRIDDVLRLLRD